MSEENEAFKAFIILIDYQFWEGKQVDGAVIAIEITE